MTARHRLPDAPSPFVGRRREVDWLAAAIERAPVAALWGPGGMGKTALALHTIHTRAAHRGEHALRVSLRGLDPSRDVHVEVLVALAEAQQLTRIDWAGLAGDVDGLTAAVIDLAEAAPFLILLDDVHHADRGQVRDLLLQLARYGRRSRWVAVGRDELSIAELPGQVLRLGPMPESDLREIAAQVAPDLSDEDARLAVSRAAGSPWTLRQMISKGAEPGAPQGLLDDLDAPSAALLRTLALLDEPVPASALASAIDVPAGEEIDRLVRRGLVERSENGLSVHDVVRDELRGGPRDRAWVESVGRALARSDDPAATVEAIHVLASAGATDAVGDVLERRGEEILAGGHAARLASHLESASAPRLVPWKLRCALEVGDARLLRAATWIESDRLEDRLVWARVLWARRDLSDALAVAREVAEKATPKTMLRHDATLLAASSLVQLGRPRDALALLASHDPPDRETALHRDVLVTHCMRLEGQQDEARKRIAELSKPVLRMKGAAREESIFGLAHAAFELGMLKEARKLVEALASRGERWSPALFEGRQALMLHAAVAVLEGDLATATVALDRLEPYVQRASHLRARVRLARCMVRVLAGDLDGYEEALAAAIQDARQVRHADALALASALAFEWATLNALPAPAPQGLLAADGATERARPDLARYAELERLRHAARAGEPLPSEIAESREDAHGGLGPLRTVIGAIAALVKGDLDRALTLAEKAVEVCRATQHAAREAEARHALCEALLARGDARLAESAAALAAQAERCSSARMAEEARFFALFTERTVDPAALEPIAAAERVSPVAARRAQALLGGRPRLDAVDRAVLESIRRRRPELRVELVQSLPEEPSPWEPGWGIDERSSALWLEDGRRIDLAHRRLLVKLLVAIADRGGEATKEDLVLTVWEEPDYHPLHHDNRLHSAVRKLRRLIEADPAEPRRLLTTEAGYALGGPTRRARG